MKNALQLEVHLCAIFRKTTDTPRLRDEAEIQRQVEEKQREIAAYRAFREEVERQRELDRQQRNQAKIRQLQLCEEMQVSRGASVWPLLEWKVNPETWVQRKSKHCNRKTEKKRGCGAEDECITCICDHIWPMLCIREVTAFDVPWIVSSSVCHQHCTKYTCAYCLPMYWDVNFLLSVCEDKETTTCHLYTNIFQNFLVKSFFCLVNKDSLIRSSRFLPLKSLSVIFSCCGHSLFTNNYYWSVWTWSNGKACNVQENVDRSRAAISVVREAYRQRLLAELHPTSPDPTLQPDDWQP